MQPLTCSWAALRCTASSVPSGDSLASAMGGPSPASKLLTLLSPDQLQAVIVLPLTSSRLWLTLSWMMASADWRSLGNPASVPPQSSALQKVQTCL